MFKLFYWPNLRVSVFFVVGSTWFHAAMTGFTTQAGRTEGTITLKLNSSQTWYRPYRGRVQPLVMDNNDLVIYSVIHKRVFTPFRGVLAWMLEVIDHSSNLKKTSKLHLWTSMNFFKSLSSKWNCQKRVA